MSRFLGSRLTLVGLLVSILVLVVGVSVATGAGSGGGSAAQSSAISASPSITASAVQVVVANCSGNAEFDVLGGGWGSDDVVLITLQTNAGRMFVGAGFPGASGGFVDDISAPVSACGVLTIQAKGGSGAANAPVQIVETK